MCVECGMNPCSSRCPNADDPPAVFVCSGCTHDILDGEDYWDIMGEQFCATCIENAKGTAEYEAY